jgi:mRNA interferase HigB
MHIISRKMLREFWQRHPDSETALARWFKIVHQSDFGSLQDLRTVFPSADKVGDLVVFNIGGNKYRLITAVHFNRGKVYIRHVLTHEDYNTGTWKS